MSLAKRWCFTINNHTEADHFWTIQDNLDKLEYLICQEERGEQGTIHIQGFLILKHKQRMPWLKRTFNERAHWELARGTPEQASAYCEKDDTYTGGLRFKFGELKKSIPAPDRDTITATAIEEVKELKKGYKRPSEIDVCSWFAPGFGTAYRNLTVDILGPYRPDLKIITLIGPPGTGKSYAVNKVFPNHGRCIYGNSGIWFQNPTSNVMVFEEFSGQIALQRMLELLDPYCMALEVKGGMAPAMYHIVILTSNTTPSMWYKKLDSEKYTADEQQKRKDAIHALYDRIGYSDGSYVPVRTCGTYIEAPSTAESLGLSASVYIQGCRDMFHKELLNATGLAEQVSDDEASQ